MGQDGNTQTAGAGVTRRPGVQAARSSSRMNDREQPSIPKNSSAAPNGAPPNTRTQPPAPTGPPPRSAAIDNPEHSNKPVRHIPSKEEIEKQELEETIRRLQEKLFYYEGEPYRREVTSIRTHLQVNDIQEPWQISQKFEDITKQVENIARNLGELLAQSCKTTRPPTSGDLIQITRHYMSCPEQPATGVSVDMEPEDFIDFGSRALINDHLMEIFDPKVFHPALKPEQNQILVDTYERIREQEPQIIAGRWRVSTFKSYESDSHSFKEQAGKFCRGTLFRFCTRICPQEACNEAVNSMVSDVEKLLEHAWFWNVLTKTSVVMLDFHPYHVLPGDVYDPEHVNLEGGRRAKPPASGSILLTTRLGLMSSEAVGKSTAPQNSHQLKANVLAAEYFA